MSVARRLSSAQSSRCTSADTPFAVASKRAQKSQVALRAAEMLGDEPLSNVDLARNRSSSRVELRLLLKTEL
eukprot:scaffold1004_cov269-Pinguiococcus_pyrenoidosus.AAC.9